MQFLKHLKFELPFLLVALSSCVSVQEASETVEKAQISAKEQTIKTQQMFEELLTYNPTKPKLRAVPHAYCYRVMQDILCYNQQIPGAQYRLVGWQGTGGAKEPIIRPLTKSEKVEVSQAPQARYVLTNPKTAPAPGTKPVELKPLEPVFIGKMPEIKAEHKVELNETTGSSIF